MTLPAKYMYLNANAKIDKNKKEKPTKEIQINTGTNKIL